MNQPTDIPIPRLTGKQLLPLMVASERRNRQKRRGQTVLLAPYPPCAVCGEPVQEQSVVLGMDDFYDRVLSNSPCGHRMSYNLKVAEQMVTRVQQIVDENEQAEPGRNPMTTAEPTKIRPGDQPLPQGGRECVQDALIADIRARRDLGIQRYGSALMTHNGRDAVQDAAEEALDLAVYLKQVQMETRDRKAELASLRAEVAAAREFAGEMREFASPHGVSVDYADRLIEAMDRAKEAGR